MIVGTDPAPPIFVAPYATIAVKSHVPVTLELKRPNFNRWSPFFLSLCGKFGLRSHVDGSAAARPQDSQWAIADSCVHSWLLGSVADDVLGLALAPDQTAHQLWVAIKALFQANKASRAVFLGHEFHSMTQGDLSIDEYCQKMKATADALRDVGHAVLDSQLVLNLLRGLNPRFSSTADNIADSDPLPNFATAREKLVLKELRLANEGKVVTETALHAGFSPCGAACHAAGYGQGAGGGGGNATGSGGGGSGSGGQGGRQGGGSGNRGPTPPAGPWVCFTPWGALQQQWRPPQGAPPQPWRPPQPGILGAYPQAHTAFAPTQISAPTASLPAAPQPGAGGWDQAGLITALNQMALQGANNWVLDTGATAHMSSSDGVAAIPDSGWMFTSDSALQLGYHGTQSHLVKDIYHSLPQNYGLFPSEDEKDVMVGAGSIGGDLFQEIDDRRFDSVLECRRGKGKGEANFATERERREQLNVKYRTLRMLFPNPTKNDRASIVGDAIEYIDELNRTVKELKILVEQKRHGNNRRKMIKLDQEAAADGESSSMRPMRDDQDNHLNGDIRSSWVQRRSKECHVDVRIVDDEVNIKLTEKKKANSLLHAAKVLDEFQLELIHVVGGIIGDHHIFMFNTKVSEGSSVYACAVAKRLLEAVDAQHQAPNIFN